MGQLKISGTAAQLSVERCAEAAGIRAHVGQPDNETPRNDRSPPALSPQSEPPAPSALQLKTLRTQAKQALVGLGWKPAVAIRAVDATLATLAAQGANPTLERTIREALQRCPRPRASGSD